MVHIFLRFKTGIDEWTQRKSMRNQGEVLNYSHSLVLGIRKKFSVGDISVLKGEIANLVDGPN